MAVSMVKEFLGLCWQPLSCHYHSTGWSFSLVFKFPLVLKQAKQNNKQMKKPSSFVSFLTFSLVLKIKHRKSLPTG